ncbi:MAG: hypothetical protein OEV40_15285 [Acidimicrobiia bacterium]|nr:hypothetical protein [Acidimicrobiia bacterium]
MTDPAAYPTLDAPADVPALSARCHAWLDEARSVTNSPSIQRLIDDIHDDLFALGRIDGDFEPVVRDALGSVAAAIETESALLATLSLASLN